MFISILYYFPLETSQTSIYMMNKFIVPLWKSKNNSGMSVYVNDTFSEYKY